MKQSVLVIGLGRFGQSAARELMRLGHDVLAVDRDEQLVNDIAPDVTHAVQADASDVEALRPSIQVMGGGPCEADAVSQSSGGGRRVLRERVGIVAGGVAVCRGVRGLDRG